MWLQNLRVFFESCPGSPNIFELHQYFTRMPRSWPAAIITVAPFRDDQRGGEAMCGAHRSGRWIQRTTHREIRDSPESSDRFLDTPSSSVPALQCIAGAN